MCRDVFSSEAQILTKGFILCVNWEINHSLKLTWNCKHYKAKAQQWLVLWLNKIDGFFRGLIILTLVILKFWKSRLLLKNFFKNVDKNSELPSHLYLQRLNELQQSNKEKHKKLKSRNQSPVCPIRSYKKKKDMIKLFAISTLAFTISCIWTTI